MLIIAGFLFMIFVLISASGFSNEFIIGIIDFPSLFIIVLPLIFFLIVTKSGKIILAYIKSSFTKDYKYSKSELNRISSAIKSTIKFVMATGLLGFLIGIINCFYLSEPEYMLVNISVILVTILYSVAISMFVFYPTKVWADNKINEDL